MGKMKRKKRMILFGSAAFLVIVAATFGISLQSGWADSAPVETVIQGDLKAQGLNVLSVERDAASDTINVVIGSKTGGSPEDAWANTVVQREADFLAQAGALTAESVAVTIVDEQGKPIHQWSGPIDSRLRPVEKALDSAVLDSLRSDLNSKAEKQGVILKDLSILSDQAQGTVVRAEVVVPAPAGDARDSEIKWATLELLGQLRDYADGSGSLVVDIYRISIKDEAGAPLVEYVVDPNAKIVRAWMASGVTPVWAIGSSSPRPASAPTTTGS